MFFLQMVNNMFIEEKQKHDTMTTTATTTTTHTPTTTEYKRLDMSRLPPKKLEPVKRDINGMNIWNPVRFKNVWNEEEHLAEEEKLKKERKSSTRSRSTQTKSTKIRRPFCKYCKHRGFPLKDCKTHYTKSSPEFGAKITCPQLLKQQCGRCGEIGHTPSYCQSPHWLKTIHNMPGGDGHPFQDFYSGMLEDDHIKHWQQPIPPALQAAYNEYEERYVKTSRVWIEMSGDHTKYTDNYILCMGGPNFDWFEVRPRTDYENYVQDHYQWMRQVQFEPTTTTYVKFVVHFPANTTLRATSKIDNMRGNATARDGDGDGDGDSDERPEIRRDEAAKAGGNTTTTTASSKPKIEYDPVIRDIISKYVVKKEPTATSKSE